MPIERKTRRPTSIHSRREPQIWERFTFVNSAASSVLSPARRVATRKASSLESPFNSNWATESLRCNSSSSRSSVLSAPVLSSAARHSSDALVQIEMGVFFHNFTRVA